MTPLMLPGTAPAKARTALLIAVNGIGAFAFAWPFLVPGLLGSDRVDRGDAPLILVLVLASLSALLFLELGRGGMGPKVVALVGVLGAAMVALRLPGFVAGFSAMFIIVLVAGNAFGPAFGFLLGAVGTFASGLFVGGLGPWLPFQMIAIGWVGAGAGLLPGSGPGSRLNEGTARWPIRIGSLALYGFAAGYLFGVVINLWSWPFVAGGSDLGWVPADGLAGNVRHYAAFYVTTSFAWDTFRAVGNATMVLLLGRPLLGALDRAARRMHLQVGPATIIRSARTELSFVRPRGRVSATSGPSGTPPTPPT
jgi:energy-coupling factor transport system substrate-specific component